MRPRGTVQRRRSVSALAFVVAALIATTVSVGTVDAGAGPVTRDVTIRVLVGGSQAAEVTSYLPTITPNGGGGVIEPACVSLVTLDGGFAEELQLTCPVLVGDTYTVEIMTPPAPFSIETRCSDAGGGLVEGNQLVVGPDGPEPGCFVLVVAPTVFLDKRVVGVEPGPLDNSDFVLEVYPAAGGAPVATASDPGVDECADADDVGVDCAFVELPLGDYVLGEEPEYGYLPAFVQCGTEPFGDGGGDGGDGGGGIIVPLEPLVPADPEIIDHPGNAFSLTDEEPFVFCGVLNVFVEGTINITTTVVNDDGGTAGPEDWTVELYDDTSTLVASAPCNADGSCLSGDFPIGEYTVGEVGPDGYSTSVSVTVTPPDEPLFPGEGDGGGDELVLITEIIDDPNATFDLEPLAVVDVEIVHDDQPASTTTTTVAPTTTTTVTTTTVTPTTAAPTTPTTLVTTTAFDAGAGTLPATGGDDGRTRNVALVAIVLLGFGLAATRLARR
jgi:hypothetical protein